MALLANQIWQCLDLDLLDGSSILAEQLVANEDTPDTRYLLSYVQYRCGQYETAKLTCKYHLDHPGCVWVFAQCCLKLQQSQEGMKVLDGSRKLWALGNDMPLPVSLGRGELSPAAFHLLYAKLQSLSDPESALNDYTISARLNPYLFENIIPLCASAKVKVKTGHLFSRFEDPFHESASVEVHHPSSNLLHQQVLSHGNHQNQNQHANQSQRQSLLPGGQQGHHSNFVENPLLQPSKVTSTPRRLETPHRILSTPIAPKSNNNLQGQVPSLGPSAPPFGPSPNYTGNGMLNVNRVPSGPAGSGSYGLFQTPIQAPPSSTQAMKGKRGGMRQQDRVLSFSFKRHDQTSVSSLGKGIFASPHNASTTIEKQGTEALETITEALELLSESEFSEALDQLRSLATAIRKTPFVLELTARLLLERGQYEDSVEVYNELRALQPDRVKGIEYMSTALWHLKRESNLAMLSYEMTRKSSPMRRHWQSWCALGNAFSLRHDTQNAIKCFQRATTINPKSEYAYTLMGYEYIANDELDSATQAFAKALQANPQHYNAWYGLGSVNYSLGQPTVAAMHFSQAIRLNPNNPVLLCFLGVVMEAQGKFPEALANYERACQLNPSSPMPRYRKAEAYLRLKRYKEALKELLETEKLAPEDATIHLAIARAHKALGEGELAVQRFTGAQQLAPKMATTIRRELDAL